MKYESVCIMTISHKFTPKLIGSKVFCLFVCFVFLRNNDMHNGFRHTHTQTFKISRHPHSCKLFLPIFFEDKRKSIILLCFSKIIFCSLRIFLTQGSNPGLLHCRQILYHLSHQGSPFKCW